MKARYKSIIILVVALFVNPVIGLPQNAFDALRLSKQNPGHDAAGLSLPGMGITHIKGLGSIVENPASAALLQESTFSMGAGLRRISESTDFAGSNDDIDENKAQVADFSLAYKWPTSRGSFVIGGGFNQTMDFNRAVSVDAFNSRNTITDMFNQSSFYGDAAFNAFAIDSVGSGTRSVLRMGPFDGITQKAEIIQSGRMGEITGFAAAEIQKDLFLGVSLGAITGSYSFSQVFREIDSRNFYDGTRGTFDFNDMISEDEIEADISGFNGRIGAIYKASPFFNVGASYRIRTKLTVKEEFSTRINTQFDNGDIFEDDFEGITNYKVTIPSRWQVGFSFKDIKNVTIAGGVERVNHSQIEMSSLADERLELSENEFIEEEFKDIWNYKASALYKINPNTEVRFGYAYNPSARKSFDGDRQFFSGGLGIQVSPNVTLDLGLQYTIWDDQTVLYQFFPQNSTQPTSEITKESVTKINALAGLRFKF